MTDRRHVADSKLRERRVIPRFSDPNLRVYSTRMQILCNVWIGVSAIYYVTWAFFLLSEGFSNLPLVSFCGVVLFYVSFQIYKLSLALRSYSDSESQSKLTYVLENCFSVLFTLTVVSLVFGLIKILSML